MSTKESQTRENAILDKGYPVKLVSMREGFCEGLVQAAKADKDIVVVAADLLDSVGLAPFRRAFPQRTFEVGVAEQNMAGVASGLAAMGLRPFAASYAVFSPGRNWEQIRTTICYNDRPVVIIGSHAGLNVGADGGSHQALEDIAMMRALPRMTVVSPCDSLEAKKAAMAVAKSNGPAYIRLSREKSPIITAEDDIFTIGKASIAFQSHLNASSSAITAMHASRASHDAGPVVGSKHAKYIFDVGIIATGHMVGKAVEAGRVLSAKGKKAIVMNLSTIKPIDQRSITRLAHQTGAIVTVEDHQIAGGMGSAVAEVLSMNFPVPIEFVGVKDRFGQSGQSEELLDLYGLGVAHILRAVDKVLIRK